MIHYITLYLLIHQAVRHAVKLTNTSSRNIFHQKFSLNQHYKVHNTLTDSLHSSTVICGLYPYLLGSLHIVLECIVLCMYCTIVPIVLYWELVVHKVNSEMSLQQREDPSQDINIKNLISYAHTSLTSETNTGPLAVTEHPRKTLHNSP